MTHDTNWGTLGARSAPATGLVGLAEKVFSAVSTTAVTATLLRLGLAVPYWRSGANKWDAFFGLDLHPDAWKTSIAESGFLNLSDITVLLFTEEFKIRLFGAAIDYPFPAVTGFLAGLAEVILPILLVLGLFTRYAAFGLLLMTIVIQLTVPSGWPLHLAWAAMALAIMRIGAGPISLDRFLRR